MGETLRKMANNPLFLPEGTVRAGITLILVGTGCFMAAKGMALPQWLDFAIGVALGTYFIGRAKNGNTGQNNGNGH